MKDRFGEYIGISAQPASPRRLFSLGADGQTIEQQCAYINAYLVAGASVIVEKANQPLGEQAEMSFGNKPVDGGHLLLTRAEVGWVSHRALRADGGILRHRPPVADIFECQAQR